MPLWASDKSQEAQGPSQRAVPPSAPECPEGASKAFTQCRAAWSGRPRSRPLPCWQGSSWSCHPPAPERLLTVTRVWMKEGAGPWSLRVSPSLPFTAGAGARGSPLIHPRDQDKDWWRDP